MTRRHCLRTIPSTLGLLMLGGGAVAQNPSPDLILLDSLVLEETDEHYIGQPVQFFVAPDGSILVADSFAETVLRYDAAGRLVGRLGESPYSDDADQQFRHADHRFRTMPIALGEAEVHGGAGWWGFGVEV